MQKTVDVLVVHRYKKRGMTWRRSGSNALLKLLKANGQWKDVLGQPSRNLCAPSCLITDFGMHPTVLDRIDICRPVW